VAKRIENGINSVWNSNNPTYTDPKTGKQYSVSFEAHVRNVGVKSQATAPNRINIDRRVERSNVRYNSRLAGFDSGTWSDHPYGGALAFAHEAGHLMNLPDDYLDNPFLHRLFYGRHTGHLMSRPYRDPHVFRWGPVQHEINGAVEFTRKSVRMPGHNGLAPTP